MRMSIFLLCSMFFITPALAKNVIEHGSFSQEKHFKGFSKPFISKGIFELNEEGLTWQVQSPVKSTLFIKQGQVYTLDSQGNEQLQKGAEPYVSLLRAILKHDRAALAEQFTINKIVNCGGPPKWIKNTKVKDMRAKIALAKGNGEAEEVKESKVNKGTSARLLP